VHDGVLASVRRAALVIAAAGIAALVLAGCASGPSGQSSAAVAKADVKSDLVEARTAVLKFLAADGGTGSNPTEASLKKYGFTPSKDTRDFTYFSNSGGVRFCIQASTPTGSTYMIYIENNSKFSSAVSGACVAGTNY
jgi:outer membrane murein-binding lipoprotein Lpp